METSWWVRRNMSTMDRAHAWAFIALKRANRKANETGLGYYSDVRMAAIAAGVGNVSLARSFAQRVPR